MGSLFIARGVIICCVRMTGGVKIAAVFWLGSHYTASYNDWGVILWGSHYCASHRCFRRSHHLCCISWRVQLIIYSLRKVWPGIDAWFQAIHVKKTEYYGGCFEGNECIKILKKIDTLEERCPEIRICCYTSIVRQGDIRVFQLLNYRAIIKNEYEILWHIYN